MPWVEVCDDCRKTCLGSLFSSTFIMIPNYGWSILTGTNGVCDKKVKMGSERKFIRLFHF
jgi:hypothetical protein